MTKLTLEEEATRDTANAIEFGQIIRYMFDEALVPRRPPAPVVKLRAMRCSVEGCQRRFASSEARIQHYRDVHGRETA